MAKGRGEKKEAIFSQLYFIGSFSNHNLINNHTGLAVSHITESDFQMSPHCREPLASSAPRAQEWCSSICHPEIMQQLSLQHNRTTSTHRQCSQQGAPRHQGVGAELWIGELGPPGNSRNNFPQSPWVLDQHGDHTFPIHSAKSWADT